MAAVPEKEEKRHVPGPSISVKVDLEGGDTVKISGQDNESVHLFEGLFDRDQLIKSGFNPQFSVVQMKQIIESGLSNKGAVSSKMGYIGDESGSLIDLRSSYRKGDRLGIVITHDLGVLKGVYTLSLNEKTTSTKEPIAQGVEETRGGDKKRNESGDIIQKMSVEIAELKRVNEALKQSLIPKLGVWQANAHSSNFLQWNNLLTTPPSGLFEMSESSTKITVLRRGLYHIHGYASILTGEKYVGVSINGEYKNLGKQQGSGMSSISFDMTIELKPGDYIRVFSESPHIDPRYNTLTIEKRA